MDTRQVAYFANHENLLSQKSADMNLQCVFLINLCSQGQGFNSDKTMECNKYDFAIVHNKSKKRWQRSGIDTIKYQPVFYIFRKSILASTYNFHTKGIA